MCNTSIGYHTFTVFRRFSKEDIARIFSDFKQYSKNTNALMIYPTNETQTCYKIDYKNKHNGIDYWQIRFCRSPMADFIEYIVEAKINPKILAGEIDYVRAANEDHLPIATKRFNEEARKISKHLGEFYLYRPNRIDYCLNLDLLELGIPCSPSQMIELMDRSNVPPHYSEYKEYDSIGHRMKSPRGRIYLRSNSVVINCYSKFTHLRDNYPDNPSLENSMSVIRFEVQCKYMKLYAMSSKLKREGIPEYNIASSLFSDHFAREVVIKYFERVIMRGDYYTLKNAIEKVKSHKFRDGKEERMVEALTLINMQRGVKNAKKSLRCENGDLSRFNRALHELVDEKINPVTIPKSFNLNHIPNLLDKYLRMEFSGFNEVDFLTNYLAEQRKHKKRNKKEKLEINE